MIDLGLYGFDVRPPHTRGATSIAPQVDPFSRTGLAAAPLPTHQPRPGPWRPRGAPYAPHTRTQWFPGSKLPKDFIFALHWCPKSQEKAEIVRGS